MSANQALWTRICETSVKGSSERAAFNLASENADDTSVEQGYKHHSPKWFAVFAASYQLNLDTMTDEMREDWGF